MITFPASPGPFTVFFAVARTGLTAIVLHPLRSIVTVASVVVVLVPYLAGLGLSRGLSEEAEAAVRFGADLYVGCEQFGQPVPVPLAAVEQLRAVPGVTAVVPRIVGRLELGQERVAALVVGVPLDHFPDALECIDGRLYGGSARNELVLGSDLARRLNLRVGSRLPPFYRNPQGEHVSEVVGIFRSDVSIWQARLMVTSFDTAARLFDQPDRATDLLVQCRPGYEDEVRRAILRGATPALRTYPLRPRVVSRDELTALLPQGLFQREGVFTALFVLAFVVGILVVLVTSGVGLPERRREIGILKATGWQTDELMLRSLVESFLLSLGAASLAVVFAYLWLVPGNGYAIAGIFLTDIGWSPGFRVPFRLSAVPVLLSFLIAFVIVLTGSLYSTWCAALAPPRDAMR